MDRVREHVPPVIAAILPSAAVAAELIGDPADGPLALLPTEAALLGPATVDKRRRELAAGRSLARRALQQLGIAPVAILTGANREPVWPDEVVGSITHCYGYCAAAVVSAAGFASIGIDAEVHDVLPADVLESVTRPEERAWIARADKSVCWDRLFFSAKESVFKAWFPIMRRWLGFEDASIVFDPAAMTFRASLVSERVLVDGRELTGFDGRYLVHGDHVLTAVAVERAASSPRRAFSSAATK
jgi:4'-phosphopantetheinyl transferase EntD